MQNIAQNEGIFYMPSGDALPMPGADTFPAIAPFAHFSLMSVYTRLGLRVHTINTRDRDLAFRLFSEALEVDNEPEFAASRGIFTIQFYCSDDECVAVISASEGGI